MTERKRYQREYRRKYVRTISGLLCSIAILQRYRARRDGVKVLYTTDELLSWVNDRKTLYRLYKDWVESKYDPKKRPTIYRMGPGEYSLENLDIGTMKQFYEKRSRDYRGSK